MGRRAMSDQIDGIEDAFLRGMSRREFLQRAAAMGLTASAAASLLAACGGGEASTSASTSTSASAPPKPDKLFLYNWQNEFAPENKTNFEAATGIEIVESFYQDNEALIAKLKAGATGYDLIVPTGYAVTILRKSGVLQPLDMTLVPNFANNYEKFQKPAYDPETDGKKYSVPWIWGTAGVAVREDLVDEDVTSWSTLWDAQYKNQIDMLDDERETIGAALKLLGYSLNSTSQDELDAATEKLIEQKPLVRAYDSTNMVRAMVSGTPLVHTWNGDFAKAQKDLGKQKLQWVLPSEGYTIWVDNVCIPMGAPSYYWAHKLIDFMCEAQNAADLTNFVRYYSPNEAAIPSLDKEIVEATPTSDELARGELMDDLGEFDTHWSEAWRRVKSA
jgi:spermidine/putrescine transport system substrate-binding protein